MCQLLGALVSELRLPVRATERDVAEAMIAAAIEEAPWPPSRETALFLLSATTELDIFKVVRCVVAVAHGNDGTLN